MQDFKITSFLTIDLGGVWFHDALLQGDSYNLHIRFHGADHALQVIKAGFVTANIPVTSRSLKALRRAMWQLAAVAPSKFTFSYPESEKQWETKNPK